MGENYREKARSLIRAQDICVLATASEKGPYCSFMAYASNTSCTEIYMVSFRDSRKYRNMRENPSVCLLIDNRRETSTRYTEIEALNISGRFQPIIEESERALIHEELSKRHPGLTDLFENPGVETIKIIIESVLLLEGPTKAYYGAISKSQ